MDKQTFINHFRLVLVHLRDSTSESCFNNLSTNYKFIIEPSERIVGSHLTDTENSYLKTWDKLKGRHLSFNQVVDLFYKANKTPKWADCYIYYSSSDLTVVHILFSRQFRDEREIYYLDRGTGPFKAIVVMPPDQLKVMQGDRFDLNWHKLLNDRKANIFTKLKRFYQQRLTKAW